MVTSVHARKRSHTGWQVREVSGIIVHEVAVPYENNMGTAARTRAFFEFALRAGPRAVRIQPDIVFATSTPLTIAIPAAYAKLRTGAPIVFEVRDLWPAIPIAMRIIRDPLSRQMAHWLERFAYWRADRIIALSPGMARGVAKVGVHPYEIAVVPNGCDLDVFRPQRESLDLGQSELPDSAICLYAGTLGQANGVSYIVDVAAEMQSLTRDVHFLIVGDGKESDLIRKRAEELGVLNRTLFLRRSVPKKEIAKLLDDCSIALSVFIDLPELWDNSANKFFDALAAGRPIAINYRGWQADLIDKHDLGLVLPPDSPGIAAAMLARFLSDRERMVKCGWNSRRLAEQEFHRDRLSEKALEVIRSVVVRAYSFK